jgi:hypothetical protein
VSRYIRVVLVTGDREWPWREVVWRRLDEQRALVPPGGLLLVVHGHAGKGADQHADDWVTERQANPDGGCDVDRRRYPRLPWAAHHKDCKPGCARTVHRDHGHRRNQHMVTDSQPNVGLVFMFDPDDPDVSKGTKGCHKLLRKARVPCLVAEAYRPAA